MFEINVMGLVIGSTMGKPISQTATFCTCFNTCLCHVGPTSADRSEGSFVFVVSRTFQVLFGFGPLLAVFGPKVAPREPGRGLKTSQVLYSETSENKIPIDSPTAIGQRRFT